MFQATADVEEGLGVACNDELAPVDTGPGGTITACACVSAQGTCVFTPGETSGLAHAVDAGGSMYCVSHGGGGDGCPSICDVGKVAAAAGLGDFSSDSAVDCSACQGPPGSDEGLVGMCAGAPGIGIENIWGSTLCGVIDPMAQGGAY